MSKRKNIAATRLGRLGGLARARKCSREQSEIGRKGSAARLRRAKSSTRATDMGGRNGR
jgi:hypothetical protein